MMMAYVAVLLVLVAVLVPVVTLSLYYCVWGGVKAARPAAHAAAVMATALTRH
jgi:hypothetical protein